MKKIFRFIGFFVGLFGILFILSAFIKPEKDVYNVVAVEEKKSAIDREKNNTIDVLFAGDSESYSAFCPSLLWNNYGYTSYVTGFSAQRLCDTYELLSYSFEKQTPKVVILETNCLYRYAGIEKDPDDKTMNYLSKALPVFKYHSRWKNAVEYGCFYNANASELEMKGFVYRTSVKPYTGGAYMESTEKSRKVPEKSIEYLDMIKKLCEDNGSQLVLVSVPSPENWSYKKHNGVQLWADKNNIPFVDLNLNDDLNIDWSLDTKDGGNHLNYTGAIKVTDYIGAYLEDNYKLEDYRNNPAYDDWNNMKKIK